MNKIIGICNLHDDPHLGSLTDYRPCGAVTFLGRYALMDFTLSNFSNSHIGQTYVLVKNGISQVRNHIGNGSAWTTNTKTGGIKLCFNESGLSFPKFNTDIANLKLNFLMDTPFFDYAVIAPSCMITTIDYRPVIEQHIASNKDITVVYTHTNVANEDFINCDKLKFDADGNVIKMEKNLGKTGNSDISLESFIVSRDVLRRIIDEAPNVSELFCLRDMLRYLVDEKEIKMGGYCYQGYVAPILDFNSYVKQSFAILNYHNRSELFLNEWPIYTTTHNTPPALYSEEAKVRHSFIANGSIIRGKVDNSIISRNVVIGEGAKIKNCIIFTDTEIGKGVSLTNVVSDKGALIKTVKSVKGEEDNLLYIKMGAKI